MNYRKFDKKMRKAKIEYTIEDKNFIIQIKIDPSKNDVAEKIIEKVLGKNEACINNVPGKFIIVRTYIISYKVPKQQLE
jgi:hypothetical protein